MTKKKQGYPVGKDPNSLANLRLGRWQKGQSGNPGGCRKGVKYVSEAMKHILAEGEAVVKANPGVVAYEVAGNLIKRAKNKDSSVEILMDRTEGKVTQPIAGQITADITFTIGKGYADSKPDIPPDK